MDVLTPVLTLIALAVGALLTGRTQERSWRRERRAQLYSEVLLQAEVLERRLTQIDVTAAWEDYRPGMDNDDALVMGSKLQNATTVAELHAGPRLQDALHVLVEQIYTFVDVEPGSYDMEPMQKSREAARAEMRRELQAPWWRP